MKDKIMAAINKMLENPNISTPYTIYNDEECCNEIMKIVDEEIKKFREALKTIIEYSGGMFDPVEIIAQEALEGMR
jgi:hypothetical protein